MSDKQPVAAAYPRLSIAYFLQFAIWASYAFALTGFVAKYLQFTGAQVGWIGAAIPIGAIIAPLLVGPIADRYFAAQKVLAFLHIVAGLLLCFAGVQKEFTPMLIAMIAVGMCYMPTIPLMNSIVFEHIPNRDNAPRVFMFGTIGWIAIVLFIQAFFGGGQNNQFFFVGAACCFILAVYALTLPNTPPKGASDGDALGLKAFTLFKKPSFVVFVITLLLVGIPGCGLFFTLCVPMLMQGGYPAPLALTTINQFSEVIFMALLPIFALRVGLKNVILIGSAAWFLRYFCFMEQTFTFALAGLLLHGLCYAFLYVAAYMYGDRVASDDIKASVQSLLGCLILGVGQVCGSVLAGHLLAAYPPQMTTFEFDAPAAVVAEAVQVEATAEEVAPSAAAEEAAAEPAAEEAAPAAEEAAPAEPAAESESTSDVEEESQVEVTEVVEVAAGKQTFQLPAWTDPDLAKSAWQMLDLSRYVTKQDPNAVPPADLNQYAKENTLTLADFPEEGIQFGETLYTQKMLQSMLRQVYAAVHPDATDVADADIKVTLAEYQKIQCNDWAKIYRIPMIMIGLGFVIFLLFGKNPPKQEEA
ncbi:MAG: MFS transporter [Thermoguttaceae bacterium]|nr:MFS transporter [Thermoguttaceae bacterium]